MRNLNTSNGASHAGSTVLLNGLRTEDSVLISVAGAVNFLSTLRCRHLCTDNPERFSRAVYWSNVLICLARWLSKCLLHITEKRLLLFRGRTTSCESHSVIRLLCVATDLTRLRWCNVSAVTSASDFRWRKCCRCDNSLSSIHICTLMNSLIHNTNSRTGIKSTFSLILRHVSVFIRSSTRSFILKEHTIFTSQEIPRISWNPKSHYRTHKGPPPVSILGQPNPVHIPTSHLLEIHPNIIHPSTPRSPQWALSLRFPHHDPIHSPFLTHMRHMPSSSHSSRFYHPHDIGWGVQII